ncbi:MAG TPA: PAS domain S-box protein, partial [Armatimonadetes bacterium]|nr:PAS domain S-box protein [Armatimonadota bacterium]
PYTDFVAPESLEEVKRLYEGKTTSRVELFVYFRLHKDGRSLPTENKVKVIHYQGRKAAAGICRDITERVEMERRMRESERLAHIGQLTTSLAHEIRNPLSSLKVNIQILLKKLRLDGNDKRRMEIMAQEISRLERILEEMLDFARPVPLELKPTSVNSVVEASIEVMEAKIRQKGLRIKKRLSKRVPKVLMDPDRMEQALINVLLNSIEVLPKGGQIEIVTREDRRDGRMVELRVRDDGPGVPEEDLPYIFDPFFSKKKGTGLGLTNVKKIVEAHGGEVRASLCHPKGMAITMRIPVRR